MLSYSSILYSGREVVTRLTRERVTCPELVQAPRLARFMLPGQ